MIGRDGSVLRLGSVVRVGRVALVGLVTLPCAGCHWLAGNPDATLNGAVVWREDQPVSIMAQADLDRVIWVRVRAGTTAGNTARVLEDRVRRLLREEGWRIDADRAAATVWLDLDIRYWGVNPVRDEAGSTYAKVLRDRRPDLLAEGETARGGRFTARSLITPVESVISSLVANVVEYDFIVDVHVMRTGGEQQESQTLIVWVRQIDLEEQPAAAAVGDRVLEALRAVFQRR